MMRTIFYVSIFATLFACASNKASIDYDPRADFAAFQTYAWSELTDEKTGQSKLTNPLVHQRVRDAIETEMNTKGFQMANAGQADVLVGYNLSVVAIGQSSRGHVSVGVGRARSHSQAGVSVGVPVGHQRVVNEGTLVISIMEGQSNSVIWQGASSREVSQQQDPQRSEQMIREVVNEILVNFPPK